MKPVITCEPPADLWLDRPDASERIKRRVSDGLITADEAEKLHFFRDKGYLILPSAVANDQIDRLLDEMFGLCVHG